MTDAPPIAELEHVSKRYDSPDAGEGPVILREVNLRLAHGEAVAVVGPSGSGKSTLLNLLGTLDRPTSGRVLLDGRDLAPLGDRNLAVLRNRRLGFVFQLHHLLPQCTAMENVLVPALAAGGSVPPVVAARGRQLLARVGLGDRLAYRPGQLSGGERQRVVVARALINRPALLLVDEPTGSLDGAAGGALGDLLVELNREEGVTLVVVTHAPALAARMDRVLELRDGTLRPQERPA